MFQANVNNFGFPGGRNYSNIFGHEPIKAWESVNNSQVAMFIIKPDTAAISTINNSTSKST